MDNIRCRACEYTSAIHRETVEKELSRLRGMKGLRLSSDELYNERLIICGGCAHLDFNNVCMMCGCYVQIRAFTTDGRCPMKKWKR